MRVAVYGGSFDPLTKGHWYMIETGLKLFDKLIVAVAVNSSKTAPWFDLEERMQIIRNCVANELSPEAQERIEVVILPSVKYLVNYAQTMNALFVLRGLRSEADFDFEKALRLVNKDIAPNIETAFLMPPREYAEISSSTVKRLVGPEGWEEVVRRYLPRCAYDAVIARSKR